MTIMKRLQAALRNNLSFLAFLVLMLVFRSAFADWMVVPSGSMNPTIVEGDRVFINKIAFGLRVPFTRVRLTPGEDPQRGDIVIFDSPKSHITLIKRVVGLPGDVIEMHHDQVWINHVALRYQRPGGTFEEDMLSDARAQAHVELTEALPGKPHTIMLFPERLALRDFGPIVVPPDHYFMMGDSRDNSEDSRFIGPIPRASIVGRASRVVISLNPENDYLPRTDRMLTPLN